MTRRHAKKSMTEMSTEELAAATAELKEDLVVDKFSAPSPEARARWEAAQRKPGRPKEGKGAKVISVSVEGGLLARSDALAARMGITRAGLIARGLKAVLAAEGEL